MTEKLDKGGVEQSSAYRLEEEIWRGASVMFLYFTFRMRTSRWSDLDGSNPSISPLVPNASHLAYRTGPHTPIQLTRLQARTRGFHVPREK